MKSFKQLVVILFSILGFYLVFFNMPIAAMLFVTLAVISIIAPDLILDILRWLKE